jgi:hypothetical protein
MTAPKPRPRSGKPSPEARLTSKLLSIRLTPGQRAALDAAAEVHGSRPKAIAAGIDTVAALDVALAAGGGLVLTREAGVYRAVAGVGGVELAGEGASVLAALGACVGR